MNPGDYIAKLMTTGGKDLPESEQWIFKKLQESDTQVTAIEKKMNELQSEMAQVQTEHKMALGRGRAYATLLIEVEGTREQDRKALAQTITQGIEKQAKATGELPAAPDSQKNSVDTPTSP